jgi:hypothetical protein
MLNISIITSICISIKKSSKSASDTTVSSSIFACRAFKASCARFLWFAQSSKGNASAPAGSSANNLISFLWTAQRRVP